MPAGTASPPNNDGRVTDINLCYNDDDGDDDDDDDDDE